MPKNKDTIISISLKPDQLDILDALVKKSPYSRSAYIRHLIMEEARTQQLIDLRHEVTHGRSV